MAQKKEAPDNEENREMDLGDLTPPKDPEGGAKPVKPPPPFSPQPDPPG
jgi:hypothetical protein